MAMAIGMAMAMAMARAKAMSLAKSIQPVMEVLSEALGSFLRSLGLSWYWSVVLVIVFYSFTRYFFASTTAHILAMYVPIVDSLISAGCSPKIAAISIAVIGPVLGIFKLQILKML